jgi:signal transduction histidine kinase
MTEIVHGRVDRDGRLVAADTRLAALHRQAGGEDGGIVAVPQIGSVVRLARSLGILVSRSVIAADGGLDVQLWVRAKPHGEDVDLSIGGWEELPKRRARFTLLPEPLKSDAALLWECNGALRLSQVSTSLAELAGLSATALQGQALTGLFQLIGDADGDLPILHALAQGRRFSGQAAGIRGADAVDVTLAAVPVFAALGGFAGFRGSATRVDQPVPDQPELDLPSHKSQVPDGQFAHHLDTALRTPLADIIANADDMASAELGPLRRDYVDYASDVASAGRHMLGLVDDLGDLQQVESAGFTVDTEEIDLADIARRAGGLLAVRAADSHVRIDKPAPDERLPAVGDFRRVLQILVNLIGNAVRYSPQDTMVWIRTEEEGDLAAVIVADQGKGIALDDHERIFEKFERVDPGEAGGSGLGLYISRRLARAMGGDITVDSAPGQGARFVLTLPVKN